MNFAVLMLLILVAAALQSTLPAIGGLRLELLPALVAVVALSRPRAAALLLALLAGFSQDALSAAPFGVTALAYGITAVVLTGLRESLDRDWPLVQMAAGAFAAVTVSVAALCVIGFSAVAIFKLVLLAGWSGLMTPAVFLAIRR